MKITAYLGASEGNDPALKTAVQELGRWIGQSGNALVYGGSRTRSEPLRAVIRSTGTQDSSRLLSV